ncbi:MAG: helix-turn-helix domain-containing protein [Atopobiaceae bacterium]|nr:helix-turn-helix domain-containing protein [Atopobiaceae bacterium]
MTATQAAAMLGVPYSTVTQMCRQGNIPAVKIGRQWRIPREVLRRICKL